jgi:U6 snRNA-associated Sm-like protein LSm3
MLLEQPLDLIKFCLDNPVQVRLKGGRQLAGKLHAFDAHLNLVLGDAKEIYKCQGENLVEEDKERDFPMLFIRGDSIILVTPSKKS